MTKILVTGSSGLVGRQVVQDLIERDYEVYSCYNIEKPEFGESIHLDLAKKDEIVKTLCNIKPDIVIHLAAVTDVELCEMQREFATLINTTATQILAQESAKQNVFFAYMSTDYVFDGIEGLKNEDAIPNPLNFYGKSKLDGEIALKNILSPYVIIRTSTPFGIHPKRKSFPVWIKENLQLNKEVPALIDQYTSPTFVPNLSKMLIEVTTKQISGTIHLAGATRISRYEMAKIIADKFNLDDSLIRPTKIIDMKWNAQRPRDSSLDVSKAKRLLDNKPQEIKQSVEFFVKKILNE